LAWILVFIGGGLWDGAMDRCAGATLRFEDTFAGSSLDTNRWNPFICDAASGGWPWNLAVGQPQPSSAEDAPNSNAADYDWPSQISTGHGLQLSLQSGSTAPGYSWTGAILCTCPATNQFSQNPGFTFTNGYVEVVAKMPYAGSGCWPAIWFLPGPGANGGEMDLHEGGELWGTHDPDRIMACNFHAPGNQTIHYDAGVSLSADYHVYGLEYFPGRVINMYFDGILVAGFTNDISSGSYFIILNESMASTNTAGWHTQTSGATAVTNFMEVAYVRAYDVRPEPAINAVTAGPGYLILGGTNGLAGAGYRVLTATNLDLAMTHWLALATNRFDAAGNFYCTNGLKSGMAQFFRIAVP
jgi:hypothetical protein